MDRLTEKTIRKNLRIVEKSIKDFNRYILPVNRTEQITGDYRRLKNKAKKLKTILRRI